MEICQQNQCMGCYACINICPYKCISMCKDKYGELHPYVDESICKHCNMCVKSCPNNNSLDFNYPQKCFASFLTDKKKRRICASGGIATILSEYVIQKKNGVVFGTRYNEHLVPMTTYAEDVASLEYFKGSKYVQSIVGEDTLEQVRKFLQEKRFVLYIGTPCQVAGLRSILHCDYENLITVDLICHGVCPTSYLTEEIAYLKDRRKLKNITDIRFRGNDSNNFCLTLWTKQKLLLKQKNYSSYYLAGFLWGVSLRENCYTCKYARPERISDITIGDFIGLGQTTPFRYSKRNVSSVTLNTLKSVNFYNEVADIMVDLVNIERDYNERLMYGPSLRYPFPRHELSSTFRDNYLKWGYVKGIRMTLKYLVYEQRIRNFISYWTYSYRIPKAVSRIIFSKKAINKVDSR